LIVTISMDMGYRKRRAFLFIVETVLLNYL
jgi:hypothetical protein